MNLVPTASTTAALALGDALAMTVLVEKGFKPNDFADLHPRGTLYRRARRVDSIMRQRRRPAGGRRRARRCARSSPRSPAAGWASPAWSMATGGWTAWSPTATSAGPSPPPPTCCRCRPAEVMSRTPVTVPPDTLAAEALHLLEQRKITAVVVVDAGGRPIGVVHLHDLWKTGLV